MDRGEVGHLGSTLHLGQLFERRPPPARRTRTAAEAGAPHVRGSPALPVRGIPPPGSTFTHRELAACAAYDLSVYIKIIIRFCWKILKSRQVRRLVENACLAPGLRMRETGV